jgi:hypothetical protein
MAKDLILVAPTQTLIVDYNQYSEWEKLGLLPKRSLEETLAAEWNRINAFLADQQIDSHNLHTGIMTNVTAMDIALDILLDTSHQFLELADVFQKALSHARPLRLSKPVRMQYDSVILLAHRVQALSPGEFSHRFLDSYNEDDTFFLYDNGKFASGETLRERHTRYMQHGLVRLAQALIRRYS